MKLAAIVLFACLLASCANDRPEPPPPATDTAAYARTPHEYRDDMMTPRR